MELTPKQFDILATKQDLEDLKQEMVTKNDFNQLLTTMDGIAKDINDIKTEKTAHQSAHDRIQEKIDDHEGRLNELELKAA